MKKPIKLKRVFLPVVIGVLKNRTDFRRTARVLHIRMTSKVNDVLRYHTWIRSTPFFTQTREEVLLTDVSVEELGLPNLSCLKDILFQGTGRKVIWKAKSYVLSKVLPVDVMMLRLAYRSQPKGEWLRAAMDGVMHPMGNKVIFRIVHGHDGVLYFDTDDGGDPDDVFDDHVRFVWRLIPLEEMVVRRGRIVPKYGKFQHRPS